MSQLASVSESLKVWNFADQELEPVSSYKQEEERFSCVSWNHTNQVVAIAGNRPKVSLIQASNGQLLSSLQVEQGNEADPTIRSLSFSGNSRFLAASISRTIQLWDLKRRQLKTVFGAHNRPVTAVCMLPTGDVAGGDQSGAIRIWDAKTSLSSEELKPSISSTDKQNLFIKVTSLNLSPISSSFLAAGYSDGSLCIWDAAARKQLRKQQCHVGDLSALSYSPKNVRLIATVGLDGKLNLIDTGSKASSGSSASIKVEGNPRCVSFHEDAIHCAVGTDTGEIFVYDWRNIKEPIATVIAHGPNAINGLMFQLPKKKSDVTSTTSSINSTIKGSEPSAKLSSQVSPSIVSGGRIKPSSPTQLTPKPSPDKYRISQDMSDVRSLKSAEKNEIPVPNSSEVNIGNEISKIEPRSSEKKPIIEKSFDKSVDEDARIFVLPKSSSLPDEDKSSATAPSSQERHNLKRPSSKLDLTEKRENIPVERSTSSITSTNGNQIKNINGKREIRKTSEKPINDIRGSNYTIESQESQQTRKSAPTSSNNGFPPAPPGITPSGDNTAEYAAIKRAIRPVTAQDLDESLQLLRYDIHREVNEIIREQVRQFALAKDDMQTTISQLSEQLSELLEANKELRKENEYLRRIY